MAIPSLRKVLKLSAPLDISFGPVTMPSTKNAQPSAVPFISDDPTPSQTTPPKDDIISIDGSSSSPDVASFSVSRSGFSQEPINDSPSSSPSVSRYARRSSVPKSSESPAASRDTDMTDLHDIDFDKFPESSQEGSQVPPSHFEMEA
ncbi:unnamed protein product [Rhizopus stolonifer]